MSFYDGCIDSNNYYSILFEKTIYENNISDDEEQIIDLIDIIYPEFSDYHDE